MADPPMEYINNDRFNFQPDFYRLTAVDEVNRIGVIIILIL